MRLPFHLTPRTSRHIEATLETTGLPEPAVRVIRRVVQRARLWSGEQRDVLDELVAHFLDGIEAGAPVEQLVAAFGEADRTAALIHHAKQRLRPPLWKAVRHAAVALVGLCLLGGFAYVSSAVSLYFYRPPATSSPAQLAGFSERLEARPVPEEPVALDLIEEARTAARVGSTERFHDGVMAALAIASELLAKGDIASDRSGALVERQTAAAVLDAVGSGWVDPSDRWMQRIAERLKRPIRLAGSRLAFAELVEQMYTRNSDGNGHLTGTGIALVRDLKKWHRPSLVDRMMEPIWYGVPASRDQVVDRFERLVLIAEQTGMHGLPAGTLDDSIEALQSSLMECLRFPPLSVLMPTLAEVLRVTEEASQLRTQVRLVLENPDSPILF
ncbi:MAG: hypothetical protein V3V49_01600 [Candidatus Krumholzibacteria bacterium]